MTFIVAVKGTLGYDYHFSDQQRPRMTVDDVWRQVSSLLSCDSDDRQWSGRDDGDESTNDDDVATDDEMHA